MDVLSVIGTVLLIVLIVVAILIILLVVFPVVYRVGIKKEDQFTLNAKIRVLYIFLVLRAIYEDGRFFWELYLFGIPIWGNIRTRQLAKVAQGPPQPAKKQPTIKPGQKLRPQKESSVEVEFEAEAEPVREDATHLKYFKDDSVFAEPSKPRFPDKIKAFWRKLKDKVRFGLMIAKTILSVRKELFMILKHIFPKKIRGSLQFGLEDPADTGMLLGLISVVYPPFMQEVAVEPDFQNKVFQCDLDMKGRFFLVFLLMHGFKIYKDPNVRQMIKEYKRNAKG